MNSNSAIVIIAFNYVTQENIKPTKMLKKGPQISLVPY